MLRSTHLLCVLYVIHIYMTSSCIHQPGYAIWETEVRTLVESVTCLASESNTLAHLNRASQSLWLHTDRTLCVAGLTGQ